MRTNIFGINIFEILLVLTMFLQFLTLVDNFFIFHNLKNTVLFRSNRKNTLTRNAPFIMVINIKIRFHKLSLNKNLLMFQLFEKLFFNCRTKIALILFRAADIVVNEVNNISWKFNYQKKFVVPEFELLISILSENHNFQGVNIYLKFFSWQTKFWSHVAPWKNSLKKLPEGLE